MLLVNTVELAVLTALCCVALGTGAAWLTERTVLPGRRLWQVLLVLPAAIPDFIAGYAWSSATTAVHGLGGAVLVMSLGLYPFVYLPVSAALRRCDPALEETAHSLGAGSWSAWARVVAPVLRPAVAGGALVVVLAVLAEYGAFEILRFQTITTEIFVEFQLAFDSPAASTLATLVVFLGVITLAGEGFAGRRRRASTPGTQPTRAPVRYPLGRATLPSLAGLTMLVAAAVGVPVGTIVYWLAASHSSTVPGTGLWSALAHTLGYAAPAALLATAAAVPVAWAAVRRAPLGSVLGSSPFLVECLPGLVVGLGLVSLSIHHLPGLYQTAPLLVVAYAILFFPLAFVCVRQSLAQVPVRIEEAAHALGAGTASTFARVTLPLMAPGLAAGFCLVLLSAVTELTATLVLAPTGVRTLATQFWAYQTNTSYGAAAPYAAAMVAIAVGPSYLLSRWFDPDARKSARRRTGAPAITGTVNIGSVPIP